MHLRCATIRDITPNSYLLISNFYLSPCCALRALCLPEARSQQLPSTLTPRLRVALSPGLRRIQPLGGCVLSPWREKIKKGLAWVEASPLREFRNPGAPLPSADKRHSTLYGNHHSTVEVFYYKSSAEGSGPPGQISHQQGGMSSDADVSRYNTKYIQQPLG